MFLRIEHFLITYCYYPKNLMKKLFLFLFVIAMPVILLLMSNSSGSGGGKSGSVGDDGHTCTDCHGGTATPKIGWITTNVPAEGYTPGQTYTVTATGTHAGVVKFGFELTVEDSQGNKVGTLQITDPARTRSTNSNHAVTHTAAGNVPSGNTNSWTMNWVAPSNVDGDVGIYAAFNAANGNGNTTGDVIYKSSIFISEVAPPPILVSIAPNQAEQGDSFLATITGSNTNFNGSPYVSMSYSNNGFEVINATSVVVVNPTTIQAQFAIPGDASAGLWDVHVDGLSLENSFTVVALVPYLVSIVPDSAMLGETVTTLITAADSRFTLSDPVISLTYSGDPPETINASVVDVISDTKVEAVFSVPLGVPVGTWQLNVNDMVLADAFTVNILIGIASDTPDDVKIYPNPAAGRFFVENSHGSEITVYSSGGKLMIRMDGTSEKQAIDISQLSRGLYIVKIKSNRSERIEKLLVN
jgi:hypothetical protein